MKRMIAGITFAFTMAWMLGTANAHHPEISASVDCKDQQDNVRVFVNVNTWNNGPNGTHNNVVVEMRTSTGWENIDNVKLRSDMTAPVSVSVVVKSGPQATFRATALGPWGANGEFGNGGESRSVTTATTSYDCPVVTVPTTSPPATTVPVTVPTVTVPVATVPPVVLLPPVVIVAPEAPAAVPVVASPRFTG
jgi:hypothetical protein